MGHFRVIHQRIWDDPAFLPLVPQTKVLFLYLITSPQQHMAGIQYIYDPMVLHHTQITSRQLKDGWHELYLAALIARDYENSLTWVRKMLHYQGRGPKVWPHVARHIEGLHPGPLVRSFLDAYPDVTPYVDEEYVAGLPEAELMPTGPTSREKSPSKKRVKKVTEKEVQEIFDRHIKARTTYFERKNGRAPASLPDLTPELKRSIREAVLKNGFEKAKAAGVGIFYSPFHTGTNQEEREHLAANLCWRIRRDQNNVETFSQLARDMETRYGG